MSEHRGSYCDVVMKGGIASGLVYPSALVMLARRYRFKSIGGTSAGAIAAAACAAAATGDRRQHAGQLDACLPSLGFRGLDRVAGELASKGFIYSLFQPGRGLGIGFRLLVHLVRKEDTFAKLGYVLLFGPLVSPLATLILLAPVLVLVPGADFWRVVASILLVLIPVSLGSGIWSVLRLLGRVQRNLLGLCTGRTVRRGGPSGLTDWLYLRLQELSGQPDGEPLLFRHLRDAPRYHGEPAGDHSINLQMITTDVSHQEPRTLPLANSGFWFLSEEFLKLFPREVVDSLVTAAGKGVPVGEGKARRVYYRIPDDAGEMPVIVAMRMSFSFPLLLSAVPLYEAIGEPRPRPAGKRGVIGSADALADGGSALAEPECFQVCWFSDGGISSNFPVHLFDAPIPRWPTFAINLADAETRSLSPDAPSVHLPRADEAAPRSHYRAIEGCFGAVRFASFLWGMVGTMQNWRDQLLARAPGHRERIIDIFLGEGEGGLNLNMPPAVLEAISRKGQKAGQVLADEFDFGNHFQVRWRSLATALQGDGISMAKNLSALPDDARFKQAYQSARTGSPPPRVFPMEPASATEAAALIDRIAVQGKKWSDGGPDLSVAGPEPSPTVQILPIY